MENSKYLCSLIVFIFVQVNGGRYYTDAGVTISPSILGLLTAWNKDKPYSCAFYDQQFVSVLLKHVFGQDLLNKDLDQMTLDFDREIFEYRVNYAPIRTERFDDFVSKKKQKQKQKLASKQ